MKNVFFWLLFSFAVIIEGIILLIPFSLSILLVYYILKRSWWILAASFFGGIILDILLVHPIGRTSLFFCLFLLLVTLYERKFEIVTQQFVVFASLLGSFSYYIFLYADIVIWQPFGIAVFSLLLFRNLKTTVPEGFLHR